ncbi:hypothetical protein [Metabacillus sp. RGM 3146]|uniref:hypothetical protein n=1 Tax=Metabacillus sp. RGM 3146 TaxID=3401092 RepID=UPI003B993338
MQQNLYPYDYRLSYYPGDSRFFFGAPFLGGLAGGLLGGAIVGAFARPYYPPYGYGGYGAFPGYGTGFGYPGTGFGYQGGPGYGF